MLLCTSLVKQKRLGTELENSKKILNINWHSGAIFNDVSVLFFPHQNSTYWNVYVLVCTIFRLYGTQLGKCIFLRSIVLPSIKNVLLDLIQNCKRRMTYFYGATLTFTKLSNDISSKSLD